MEVEESSSSEDGPTQGTLEWLRMRIFCRCTRCKHQIRRERRIAMQHVKEYGEMHQSELNIPNNGLEVSGMTNNLVCVL